jgi:hypothetical protein
MAVCAVDRAGLLAVGAACRPGLDLTDEEVELRLYPPPAVATRHL